MAGDVTLRILGPVEVDVDGVPVPIARPRQRAVLAYLVHAGPRRTVPIEDLVEALWAERSPSTARSQVQADVAAVRRAIRRAGGSDPVETRTRGYRLTVEPAAIDVGAVAAARATAARRAASGDPAGAAGELRAALGPWRGPALADLAAPFVEAARAYLEEFRAQAHEQLFDHVLAAGGYAGIIADLTTLVAVHPTRERFVTQLMTALYRDGRQAEALAAGRSFRSRLAFEHGLDPTEAFDDLESAILRRDPELTGGPGGGLPAEVRDFVGRQEQLAQLDEVRAGSGRGLVVVSGPPGVGKTALAVRWAHRAAGPDGGLFVALDGGTTRRTDGLDALTGLLRAAGIPNEQIPADADRAADRMRAAVASRRPLIVLDDAVDADQVRAVLAAAPGCFVVVTSRDRLGGLIARDGAHAVRLDVLPPAESVTMLRRLVGDEQVDDDPDGARELAGACDGHPLALRIAASMLAGPEGGDAAALAARIRDGGPHALGGALRAVLDGAYRALPAGPRAAYRAGGLVPGPTFGVALIAAATGLADADVRAALARLVGVSLIDRVAEDCYARHDLLRAHAAGCADRDEAAAVADRVANWYLAIADRAGGHFYSSVRPPQLPPPADPIADPDAALALLDRERPNLVAAVCDWARTGRNRSAWMLAGLLRGYLFRRGFTRDWWLVAAAARDAAAAAGPAERPYALATAHLSLGLLYQGAGDQDQALGHFEASLMSATEVGWDACESAAASNMAGSVYRIGRVDEAADLLERARRASHRAGSVEVLASILGNLGHLHWQRGQLHAARSCFADALDTFRVLGAVENQAHALNNLSRVALALDDPGAALTWAEESRRLFHDIGASWEALAIQAAADAYSRLGRLGDAAELAGEALEIGRRTGNALLEADALTTLGRVALVRGDHAGAVDGIDQAVAVAEAMQESERLAAALCSLAEARLAVGDCAAAAAAAQRAADVARAEGRPVAVGEALTRLAEVALAAGDPDAARRHAAAAVKAYAATDCQTGADRPRSLLAGPREPVDSTRR